ncbi:MAG: serine/threonine protein kinase [Acidimicrobiales bacterium]|nr:serine/threonine protein kinase [Acidimicrobiales bacterium]
MNAGDRVGPYQLVEPLGTGGMGEVWSADDPTGAAGGAPRRVALKLLDPALVGDPDARARFAREVAAARRVRSSSVAGLLDADLEADRPWLASAYVAGPTLHEHVSRHGPLEAGPLRALATALADALVAIHAAGVVHRDLTPRNVVLGPDGPRVVDFGIAWFPGAPAVTRTGAWVGTPAWMPPERLTSDEVTAASDVWSWGAVLAYAALGRPAVGAASPDVAAQRVVQGIVDLDGVPDALLPWVEAAMAPDPRARPTATELRAAMLDGAPVPPPPPSPPPVGPELTAVAGTRASTTRPGPDRDGAPDPTRVHPGGPAGPVDHAGGGRGIRDRRTLVRWASALVVLAGAVVLGLVADPLVAIIALAVLVMVAVVLRVARESRPEGATSVPPTWAVGLAGPIVLAVGLVRAFGPLWGMVALVALAVLFVLLGGDIG